jgi:large conductance mechanosensitive channel
MKMLKEFRAFAFKGNMIDMAVGIIIGAAFGRVVQSLVKDIIMPPIGMAVGGVDFSDLYINLSGQSAESLAAAKEAGLPVIAYGLFINAVTSFLIVALAVFLLIRGINRLKREEETPPAAPSEKECPYCFSNISIRATRCSCCTSELEAA